MESWWWIWLAVIILLLCEQKYKKTWTAQFLRNQRRKDRSQMMEAAKQFIGKDCYIYLLSGECRGIIREVTDHALIVEMKKTRELINLDFVLRIRELPGKDNG